MPSAAGPAPLRVELTADPEEFAARALTWLAQDPVTTNVIATVLRDARDGDLAAPDSIWVLVTSGGQVMGAGMHAPPYPVYLPPLPDGAAAAVAQTLLTAGRGDAGVSGGPAATIEFVDRWCARTGAQARLERAEAMHVLADLAEPQVSGGRPRRATARDAPLCEQWLVAFHAEAMPDRPPTDVSQPVAHMIRRGTLTLWQDGGQPVSLAGWRPSVAGVGRIGPVYTPARHRRHGYAAAVTAAATRSLLAAGAEHVMLITDLANSTANGVYARLGYRRVGDLSQWLFTAPT